MFFFVKKNQKTFAGAVASCRNSSRQRGEKFLLLFSKRSLPFLFLFSAAHASDLRVCVDDSTATVSRDKAVAAKVAKSAGMGLSVVGFDGGGDDGVTAKTFSKLLSTKCDLLMGYPVDLTGGVVPPGLLATKPYAQTGFVLVTAAGDQARTLADLAPGTEVAVTYETAPNLYFPDHSNILPDVHTTEEETMQTIAKGLVKAAMIWQPTVESYQAQPGAAKLAVHPLDEPHARYNVVALYLPKAQPQAETFNATKISTQLQAGQPPAIYTEPQAKLGFLKYLGNCAMCHGTHLEGRSGPSLKGPNWANAKADYSVGEVFTVVSQQMPATSPGSLEHEEYVDIMAYLLQQNGYPAGSTALQFDGAAASKTKLLYHATEPHA